MQNDADWLLKQSSILICSRGKVPPAHTGHHFFHSIDEELLQEKKDFQGQTEFINGIFRNSFFF